VVNFLLGWPLPIIFQGYNYVFEPVIFCGLVEEVSPLLQ